MERPDDSPTRSLREARRMSIPMSMPIQSSENHPLSSSQPQQQPQQPQSQQPPSGSSGSLPPFPRRRSSPLANSSAQNQQQHQQHVSASISQSLSSSHSQLHSHMDDPQDSTAIVNQRHTTPPQQSQPQPPQQQQLQQQSSPQGPAVAYPRSIQRVPPPPMINPSFVESDIDTRYNALHDEWSLTDQYLDADHHPIHDSSSGQTGPSTAATSASASASMSIPKGPIIEREREIKSKERDQQQKDNGDMGGGSAGSNPQSRRSDSLRRATRPPLPQPPQTQSQTKNNESPPPPSQSSGQLQTQPPQRPPLYSDRSSSQTVTLSRSSPTYVSVPSTTASGDSQPSPTHKRDNSPPFRYDERERERSQPAAKARTPDRSLPVQEENEVEEDDTIKPSPPLAHTLAHAHVHAERDRERERVRERERERERQRERERDRELDSETIKPRQSLGHRLPTPQFSNSPMMTGSGGDRETGVSVGSGSSATEDLSTTVIHGEHEYVDELDGRSSRAGHRYEEEEEEEDRRATQGHVHVHERVDHGLGQQPDIEEQEDTETYTPRSPPATLPQSIAPPPPHANVNHHNHPNNHVNNNTNHNNVNNHAERMMYQYHNSNPSMSHLHFRPRTASSDAGGMPNLDAAVLQHPFASEYSNSNQHQHNIRASRDTGMASTSLEAPASFAQSYPFGAHTSPPQRVPTIEEIRAIADGALYRQTTRPGAPIPPTPPNNGTGAYPTLAYPYLPPSMSPPPPRATPYPYSYPSYQHMAQQSPDPHQMLQHLLGMQTDSTFSPSSTPYPTYDYSPFLPEHFRRGGGGDPTMSMRSSPSHMPVNLPFFPIGNVRARAGAGGGGGRKKGRTLRRTQSRRELVRGLPPRGESTEPRETTPEPLDDDDDEVEDEVDVEEEEEEEEDEYHDVAEHSPREGMSSSTERGKGRGGGMVVVKEDNNGNGVQVHNEDDDEEANWVDEDDEEDETVVGGDAMGFYNQHHYYESLPVYHPNPEKRRRRWEARWNELVKAFQNFDRETNSSMVLMAAPAKSNTTGNNVNPTFYSIRSRSLRRTTSQSPSKQSDLRKLRTLFRNLVTSKPPHQNQHQQHPHQSPQFRNQQHLLQPTTSHMSLAERFEHYSSSSSDTIDSETREEELKNTLGAALSTINALTNIYEGRDQRWVSEMGMRRDERERVDILLRQAFGFGLGGA